MPIHAHFFSNGNLTGKVCQTELILDERSGFISKSVYARLQISYVSSSYRSNRLGL